jgi:thiamine biosynthesis protein ThiI
MKLQYDFILIRYGELALKGRNRKQFEQQLAMNIKRQMRGLNVKVERTYGRMYLLLNGEDVEGVSQRLKRVFGIKSFSPALKVDLDLAEMQRAALQAILAVHPQPATFKVNVRRPNKRFPYRSAEMNHQLGSHILVNTEHLKVDVHRPDVELLVEIRDDAAYIMCEVTEGAGGLPVGSSGKVMLMLSGGIDSPVAGYLCLKRGLTIEGVHFHSYPFTSERAKQKVVDLARKLSTFSGQMKLHIVPFTKIQTEIRKHVPEAFSITIMRRFMLRIAEGLAEQRQALGIATGDNVGQVASQTLESMHTINEVTNFPILRPLVTMDKLEIIRIAQDIDTYETSILPYEDCCTIFQPKNPKTKPTREQANKIEQSLALEDLVHRAISETETLTIYPDQINSRAEEEQSALDNLF